MAGAIALLMAAAAVRALVMIRNGHAPIGIMLVLIAVLWAPEFAAVAIRGNALRNLKWKQPKPAGEAEGSVMQ